MPTCHQRIIIWSCCVLFSFWGAAAWSQRKTNDPPKTTAKPRDVKTLEQVRQLGPPKNRADAQMNDFGEGAEGFGAEGFGAEGFGGGGFGDGSDFEGGYGMASPDPRDVALEAIRKLRSRLNSPKHKRTETADLLRAKLKDYFIADMQHRVNELDKIKAKAAKLELTLQKRLDLQQESIDLQLKLFLREADQLEFFRDEDAGKLFPQRGGMGMGMGMGMEMDGGMGMEAGGGLGTGGGSPK